MIVQTAVFESACRRFARRRCVQNSRFRIRIARSINELNSVIETIAQRVVLVGPSALWAAFHVKRSFGDVGLCSNLGEHTIISSRHASQICAQSSVWAARGIGIAAYISSVYPTETMRFSSHKEVINGKDSNSTRRANTHFQRCSGVSQFCSKRPECRKSVLYRYTRTRCRLLIRNAFSENRRW